MALQTGPRRSPRRWLRWLAPLPLLIFTATLAADFASGQFAWRARRAFDAGDLAAARADATAALAFSLLTAWPTFRGQGFFDAHLVLGQLALRDGDLPAAEGHLLAAGRTGGSPVLGSFGPNMALALDLLQRGDREPVLRFFTECRRFWWRQTATLDRWSTEVQLGQTPEFGANLRY